MFDERAALKLRLDQLKDAEISLIRELQKERAIIFNRLRELDQEVQSVSEDSYQEMKFLESVNSFLEAPHEKIEENQSGNTTSRRARPSRRSKTTKMRDTAIKLLKEQTEPIRGIDLKKVIEEQTDFQIANMTTFMNTIIKADPKILKIGRGLYIYKDGGEQSEAILLGTEDNNE